MGIAERKVRHREEVSEAILNAAWDIVTSEGWHALSIRKIAEAIEYSAPVIYDHFENKESILETFVLQGFQKLNGVLQQAKAENKDPAEQIKSMGKAYWRFANENLEYYQIMYGLGMPTCEDVEKTEELKEFCRIIIDPISQLTGDSVHNAGVAHTKFKTFWSLLHGLISIHILNNAEKAKQNEDVLTDFTEVFIEGIQTSHKK